MSSAMRLPEAFRSLRYRDFRVFFVAQTISQIATWMHSVAQTWLILALTNSPRLLGLITMLHWGPILLLALPSGAIADRVAKRRLLIATQAAQACTALTVAALVATGVVAYWHVGVLALCAGLANTLFNVVRQSFVNETVGRDDVVNAVALSSAAFNGARIVGYTGVIASAGCQTSLQLRSSDELRGRIMSLFTLIHGGCFPIAAPLIGVVAERSSVSAAFFVWGAGGLAALALLMGDRRRLDRRRPTLASAIDAKAATE